MSKAKRPVPSERDKVRNILERASAQGRASIVEPLPVEEVSTPVSPPPVEQVPRVASQSNTGYLPLQSGRQLAQPHPKGADSIRRTFNLAPVVVDGAYQWLQLRRGAFRQPPALAWLISAAMRDFPTEIQSLWTLARVLPEDAFADGPQQLGGRVPRETATLLADAHFKIKLERGRGPELWHCMSGALAVQLQAEGVPIAVR